MKTKRFGSVYALQFSKNGKKPELGVSFCLEDNADPCFGEWLSLKQALKLQKNLNEAIKFIEFYKAGARE